MTPRTTREEIPSDSWEGTDGIPAEVDGESGRRRRIDDPHGGS